VTRNSSSINSSKRKKKSTRFADKKRPPKMDSHHLNEARRSLSFRLDPRRSADSPPRYDAVTAKNVVEFGQRLDRFALGLAAVGNGAVKLVDRLLQFCTMAHEPGYDGCFGCVHNSKCK
jgi:hypothetical protein